MFARTTSAAAFAAALAAAVANAQTAPHDHGRGAASHAEGHAAHADPHAAHRKALETMRRDGAAAAERVVIATPDAPLRDEAGAATTLADSAGGRIVVLDFIFTSCTTVCPVTSAMLAQTRAALGPAMSAEVAHISLSTDPVTDSPDRLAAYKRHFPPTDGWTLLTGEKRHVDAALTEFGAYAPDFRDHPQMILVGDPERGAWRRFYGLPDPEEIAEAVNRARHEKMGM
jgi:protein SCO1/2